MQWGKVAGTVDWERCADGDVKGHEYVLKTSQQLIDTLNDHNQNFAELLELSSAESGLEFTAVFIGTKGRRMRRTGQESLCR
jgi:hypothetical protein